MNIKIKREHVLLAGALLSGIVSGYAYASVTLKRKYETEYTEKTNSFTRALQLSDTLSDTLPEIPIDDQIDTKEMEEILFDRKYSYPEETTEVGTVYIDEMEFFNDISREKKFIDVLDDDGALIFLLDGEVVDIEDFLGPDASANLLTVREAAGTEDAEVYIRNNDTDVDYEVSFSMP